MEEIQRFWIEAYNSNLEIQPQQMTSKLLSTVRVEPNINAETHWLDRVGTIGGQKRTTRFAPAPNNRADTQRRGIVPGIEDTGHIFDRIDELRQLTDPSSEIVLAQRAYLGREIDRIIIAAATGGALFRNIDKTVGSAAFDTATRRVAVDIMNKGDTPANTGLNIGKLVRAQTILADSEIDPESDELVCVLGARQVADLLEETKVGSSDYNNLLPLTTGRMGTFLGMSFVRSSLLPVPVANQRGVLVYSKRALVYGHVGPATTSGYMTMRSDIAGNPPYAYAKIDGGAVRRHDEGVVQILCLE